jgi:mono/diheme cytochrome c family protein
MKLLRAAIFFSLLRMISSQSKNNQSEIERGKIIFNQSCNRCHAIKGTNSKIFPLQNIRKIRGDVYVYKAVQNFSKVVVIDKNKTARKVWLEARKAPMPVFRVLSKKDIDPTGDYIDSVP